MVRREAAVAESGGGGDERGGRPQGLVPATARERPPVRLEQDLHAVDGRVRGYTPVSHGTGCMCALCFLSAPELKARPHSWHAVRLDGATSTVWCMRGAQGSDDGAPLSESGACSEQALSVCSASGGRRSGPVATSAAPTAVVEACIQRTRPRWRRETEGGAVGEVRPRQQLPPVQYRRRPRTTQTRTRDVG